MLYSYANVKINKQYSAIFDTRSHVHPTRPLRARCTDLTKWLTMWLTIDPLQEALTVS